MLSVTRAVETSGDVGLMIPDMKKLRREASAVEVMGPVDNGERMIARNGFSRAVNGRDCISESR